MDDDDFLFDDADSDFDGMSMGGNKKKDSPIEKITKAVLKSVLNKALPEFEPMKNNFFEMYNEGKDTISPSLKKIQKIGSNLPAIGKDAFNSVVKSATDMLERDDDDPFAGMESSGEGFSLKKYTDDEDDEDDSHDSSGSEEQDKEEELVNSDMVRVARLTNKSNRTNTIALSASMHESNRHVMKHSQQLFVADTKLRLELHQESMKVKLNIAKNVQHIQQILNNQYKLSYEANYRIIKKLSALVDLNNEERKDRLDREEQLKKLNDVEKSDNQKAKEGNIQSYVKTTLGKLGEATGVSMLKSMMEMGDMAGMMNPMDMAMDALAGFGYDKLLDKNTRNTIGKLNNAIGDTPKMIQALLKKGKEKTSGTFMENIFGSFITEDKIHTNLAKSRYTANNLNSKVDFDNRTHQTINDIMPGFLSKIYSALTNTDDELFYDRSKGKFDSKERFLISKKKELEESASYEMDDLTKDLIKKHGKDKDGKYSEEIKKGFRQISLNLAQTNGDISALQITAENVPAHLVNLLTNGLDPARKHYIFNAYQNALISDKTIYRSFEDAVSKSKESVQRSLDSMASESQYNSVNLTNTAIKSFSRGSTERDKIRIEELKEKIKEFKLKKKSPNGLSISEGREFEKIQKELKTLQSKTGSDDISFLRDGSSGKSGSEKLYKPEYKSTMQDLSDSDIEMSDFKKKGDYEDYDPLAKDSLFKKMDDNPDNWLNKNLKRFVDPITNFQQGVYDGSVDPFKILKLDEFIENAKDFKSVEAYIKAHPLLKRFEGIKDKIIKVAQSKYTLKEKREMMTKEFENSNFVKGMKKNINDNKDPDNENGLFGKFKKKKTESFNFINKKVEEAKINSESFVEKMKPKVEEAKVKIKTKGKDVAEEMLKKLEENNSIMKEQVEATRVLTSVSIGNDSSDGKALSGKISGLLGKTPSNSDKKSTNNALKKILNFNKKNKGGNSNNVDDNEEGGGGLGGFLGMIGAEVIGNKLTGGKGKMNPKMLKGMMKGGGKAGLIKGIFGLGGMVASGFATTAIGLIGGALKGIIGLIPGAGKILGPLVGGLTKMGKGVAGGAIKGGFNAAGSVVKGGVDAAGAVLKNKGVWGAAKSVVGGAAKGVGSIAKVGARVGVPILGVGMTAAPLVENLLMSADSQTKKLNINDQTRGATDAEEINNLNSGGANQAMLIAKNIKATKNALSFTKKNIVNKVADSKILKPVLDGISWIFKKLQSLIFGNKKIQGMVGETVLKKFSNVFQKLGKMLVGDKAADLLKKAAPKLLVKIGGYTISGGAMLAAEVAFSTTSGWANTRRNFGISKGANPEPGMYASSIIATIVDNLTLGILNTLSEVFFKKGLARFIYTACGGSEDGLDALKFFNLKRARVFGVAYPNLLRYETANMFNDLKMGADILNFKSNKVYKYWKEKKYEPINKLLDKLLAANSMDKKDFMDLSPDEKSGGVQKQLKLRDDFIKMASEYVKTKNLSWLTATCEEEAFLKHTGEEKKAKKEEKEKKKAEEKEKSDKVKASGGAIQSMSKTEEKEGYSSTFNKVNTVKVDDKKNDLAKSWRKTKLADKLADIKAAWKKGKQEHGNRAMEMVDKVRGAVGLKAKFNINERGDKPGDLSAGVGIDKKKVPQHIQQDPRWKSVKYQYEDEKDRKTDKPWDLGWAGCGPTSLSMILSSISGVRVFPEQIASWNVENGYRNRGSGTKPEFFMAICQALGIEGVIKYTDSMNLEGKKDLLKSLLMSGHPVMLLGSDRPSDKKALFLSGHYIVANKFDPETNEISIMDPNGSSPSGVMSANYVMARTLCIFGFPKPVKIDKKTLMGLFPVTKRTKELDKGIKAEALPDASGKSKDTDKTEDPVSKLANSDKKEDPNKSSSGNVNTQSEPKPKVSKEEGKNIAGTSGGMGGDKERENLSRSVKEGKDVLDILESIKNNTANTVSVLGLVVKELQYIKGTLSAPKEMDYNFSGIGS